MATITAGQSQDFFLSATDGLFVTCTGVAKISYENEILASAGSVSASDGEVRIGYFGVPMGLTISALSGTCTVNTSPSVIEPLTARQAGDNNDSSPLDVKLNNASVLKRTVMLAAKDSFNSNPHALPIMATPPTMTAPGTTLPAGQTKAYLRSTFPDIFRISGGQAFGSNNRIRSAVIWTTGGNGGANDGSQCSFSRFRFLADANKIAFRLNGSAAAYRFIVDGQYVSLTGTLTAASATSPNQYILMDFTSAGGRKEREVTIECMGDQGVVGVYVGPTEAVFEAPESMLRTACLGDSYCFGSSATLLGDGVDAVMADYLGWTSHMNSGSGGTGWATVSSAYTFLQRIQNGDLLLSGGVPDVICLQGSINDKNAAAATVTANCLSGLRAARSLAPNAIIFVFGVWGAAGGADGTLSIAANEAAIQLAVAQFSDMNTFFIPINGAYGGAWLTGTGTVSSPTGTGNADAWMLDASHLGDYGTSAAGKLKAAAIMRCLNGKSF